MSTLSEIKQKFAVSKNAALRIQYLLKQEEKTVSLDLKLTEVDALAFNMILVLIKIEMKMT